MATDRRGRRRRHRRHKARTLVARWFGESILASMQSTSSAIRRLLTDQAASYLRENQHGK